MPCLYKNQTQHEIIIPRSDCESTKNFSYYGSAHLDTISSSTFLPINANSIFMKHSLREDKMKSRSVNSYHQPDERSACGVGFVAGRKNVASHEHLAQALYALRCVEHRGACGADGLSSDGAGLMTDIPFEYFGYDKGSVAIAVLFIALGTEAQRQTLKIFSDTFAFFGLPIESYRDVPINPDVLGAEARRSMPAIKHVIIRRPDHCRTDASFNKLLYTAKQLARTRVSEHGLDEFFFASISTNTIVYKALTPADRLEKFYLDLQQPTFKTRFAMFHRRFSTNTRTAWDKAQPFRLIAHNGEINTIAGNRSWGYSREKSLGLREGELLTHHGISDTGTLNEMVEALLYRSSIPSLKDVLSILVPPANSKKPFYKFWSRAMEPWDGPAFITFSDGQFVGARLDRNGFRPCRWAMTDAHFFLSSEAGSFNLDESRIIAKGTLQAGSGVVIDLESGETDFRDSSDSDEHYDAAFDPHLIPVESFPVRALPLYLSKKYLFGWTEEDETKILMPMIQTGKEPIGSMGDTARPAILSDEPRSFFDYFYQNFAQVTNPPVDYIRESMVADLSIELGKKPNIFSPKELIPPQVGIELHSPVLSLGEMAFVESFHKENASRPDSRISAEVLDMTFRRSEGFVGFRSKLTALAASALRAVQHGASVLILSDKNADDERLPIPSLLALRAIVNTLNDEGVRLDASIVVHTGSVRSTHHLACLIGFGATAVCPYLALETARYAVPHTHLTPDALEKNLIRALETGLLKVMSKMGISVVKSYQSARLFAAIGIGKKLSKEFFPELYSPIGGIEIEDVVEDILNTVSRLERERTLINTHQFKESNHGTGERHSMTNSRSKLIHKLVRETHTPLDSMALYAEYLKHGDGGAEPVNLRHLFDLKTKFSPDGSNAIIFSPDGSNAIIFSPDGSNAIIFSPDGSTAHKPLPDEAIQPREEILKTFGSGAMSFGAISAESQRDIFLAMREIGGRSNSGEGGENPYYFTSGITGSIKQVASGRFGVTAEYLITGEEIQIKVAQGAKPGEGGQLMAVKVNADIARARHSLTGIDLISPPPLHDIYSIEDLKELIYELRQVHPAAKINVKLVSGAGVGTIAVGVAKAGADVIHISGGDGGTGAASLSSMKHAGLPWEVGLLEAHRALVANNLRGCVTLRTDGGLSTGKDIVTAALLGAEEYEFGKLLLVAQGCVMARICEKNTCPTGIATHDPKFKAKYKGDKNHIVSLLHFLADDVRRWLMRLGVPSLHDLLGRTDLLKINEQCVERINARNLDLSFFLSEETVLPFDATHAAPRGAFNDGMSALNKYILADARPVLEKAAQGVATSTEHAYNIFPTERAALASLSGEIASLIQRERKQKGFHNTDARTDAQTDARFAGKIHATFTGSAGQGFGVFLTDGISARLEGEANDSVCKSMSGGKVVIVPPAKSTFAPEQNAIIGNCALYGATGGTLYVNGIAGDRFAVRNSGATAVVEGTGLHACEYMTNGLIVILGHVEANLGAGMTGGTLYLCGERDAFVNRDYITPVALSSADETELKDLLEDYLFETKSRTAKKLLDDWATEKHRFKKYLPLALAKARLSTVAV
jgi:glutamate synthase domain-containing protein 2/glutamate synthase domain-containing protein 1/glutamate synthase domain-containing protein 3